MNAKEAKQKAYSVNVEQTNGQYNKVQKSIENAANQGKYSVTVDYSLLEDVSTKLQQEGFKVQYHSDQRDGSYTEITWR